ncbi:nitrate reductase cytochrome c-type subunit [Sulfurovum sp.]|uniref:nitrate reductase cytochrome c-type subunit n=1 Tax=Sulfurovum sp. TaxID=1969726 RepID=UPI0025E96C7B|nr:nitrate reductase cytochrome c-type subunit [Sulfurovum sp.]
MKNIMKTVALGTLLATSSAYAAVSIAVCAGCHGQHFEQAALGKSKIVKDMSLKEIIHALKGYNAGTYGDTMKELMVQQVRGISMQDLEKMAMLIKVDAGTQTEKASAFAAAAAVAAAGGTPHMDLNEGASDTLRIMQEDLGAKQSVSEENLGLRKTDIYSEENKTHGNPADYDRPAPGASTRFERAYKDAPPMIPHSVDGLLPITKMNNQCLGCHMPEVAPSVGATPIPATHFTNYRPDTRMKDGMVLKEGQVLGSMVPNTSDIVIADAHKGDTLYQGRFNCTQCHAPQSKTETSVANTFRPDYGDDDKAHSSLIDHMNEGIDYEVSESAPFMEDE